MSNEFIGLYGRQSGIDTLQIPEWVTIVLDEATYANGYEASEIPRQEAGEFIADVMEALAIVGAHGLSVVLCGGKSTICIDKLTRKLEGRFKFIKHSRPVFRFLLANSYGMDIQPEIVTGEGLYIFSSGDREAPRERTVETVNGFVERNGYIHVVDLQTTSFVKTTHPFHILNDAAADETLGVNPRAKAHFKSESSGVLLYEACYQLLVNTICKPTLFPVNRIFNTAIIMDTFVRNIYNERAIRPTFNTATTTGTPVAATSEGE